MLKRNLLFALISGLLLALSMPKPGIWVLAWVALVPLFVSLRDSTPVRAGVTGLIAGLVYYAAILHWITIFGYLPWALLAIHQALFIALFAAIASRLMPSRIGWPGYAAVPAVWVVMQWSRTFTSFGFPWASFAHINANNLIISQLASVTGLWGIDFLVCLIGLALADMLIPYSSRRRYMPAILALAIICIVCAGGYLALRTPLPDAPKVKIAAIQGNMPNDVVPDASYQQAAFNTYASLSMRAAIKRADVIIWPETALSTIITDTYFDSWLSRLAAMTHTNYLIGAYDAPDNPSNPGGYNAAHFYNRDGKKLGVYRKVQLVPFGEFVPLRDKLPFLKNYKIRDVDLLAAPKHKILSTEIGKIGTAICFESLFPQICRQETKRGASMLFIITNDAWFERSQAARQHLMMAKLRAIENRRYVVRAADTGISALIDPYGRTIKEIGIFKQGTLEGEITPMRSLTLYTRLGDYFAYACLGIVVVSIFGAKRWFRAPKG